MDNKFGTVGLLCDDDSLVNAQSILLALENNLIQTNLIIVPKNPKILLENITKIGVSRVLLALSSTNWLALGYIQSILEILNIHYTGSRMSVCFMANDLAKVKKIWQISGVASIHSITIDNQYNNLQEIIDLFGFPLAIKSNYLNIPNTVKVNNLEQLQNCFNKLQNKQNLLIAPWVIGDYYAVHIVGKEVLAPICLTDAINQDSLNINKIQKLALNALAVLSLINNSHVVQVNIIRDVNDDFWVDTIQFMPEISQDSLITKASEKTGFTFEALIEKILLTSFINKKHHLQSYTI